MYKIINDETCPSYLKSLLPKNDCRRSARLATHERPDTGTFHAKSFIPKTLADWNLLLPDIRNAPSLPTFKNRYHAKYGKNRKVKLETIFPRKHEIIINKFRAGFTNLNADLHRHNYRDIAAMCDCGEGPETSFHYFFKCKRYTNIRNVLTEKIRLLLKVPLSNIMRPQTKAVRVILYADDDKIVAPQNRSSITKAVIEYILATHRFNT